MLALIASPVLGQTYDGRVSHVLAADRVRVTIVTTCLEPGCPELGDSLRISLSEIDAPEGDQPHGEESTDALLARVHEKVVTVMQEGANEQGRPVGHLYLEGEWLNGWLVSEGLAWVNPPSAKTMALHDLQDDARAQHRGLWRQPAPVEPWEWRDGARESVGPAETTDQPQEPHARLSPAALDGAHNLVRSMLRAVTNG
ncbi:thermonuclease family protein [Halomonas sp. LBP4]|uniref:thermonuclease family protein n=1 Tax=Halomonas sp. LBP4 TaxID=2044917 RepID=UPI0021AC2F14|nr:thermonuclease family protein [Halomonas sp. LBP4]